MTSTAFTGGLVWTAGFAAPRELDVLVTGNTITDVADRGALELGDAEIVDLTGRLLMPGFQDAHAHVGTGGVDLLTVDLSVATSVPELYEMIGAYAAAHPELEWVIGGGWNRELFTDGVMPNRQTLDELVGGRPAFMQPYDRHGAWVSSAALERAGVTADTPDPVGGYFRREADGTPTGMVEEEAVPIVRAVMPVQTLEERIAATLRGQEYLLSVGITSVQDAIVGTGLGLTDHHDAYCALAGGPDLRLRVTAALWWDPTRGVEQIPEILERRRQLEEAAGPEKILADTVKIMVDGSDVLFMDAARIRDAVVALDGLGFAIHFHAYGDAATAWILDAVEAAISENGARPRRHHIAHLFVVAEPEFARFAELGVTANVQGFWAGSFVPHEHMGATTRTDHAQELEYPFGRIHAAGARLAGGSDWPVTTADPLVCSLTATGEYVDPEIRRPLAERDKLDALAMFTAYTTGSAWVNGRASSTGRIAPGFLADLVVLDGNVFDGPDALRSARVAETWIDGRREYAR